MTMIEQLPVINLLALLAMALLVPLLRGRSFKTTLILGLCVLLGVLLSSILILYHVHTEGAFYYHFGGHSPVFGIELLINEFSALFTMLIIALVTLVYVYSTGDATEGIGENEYGRYYILLFILLFSMFGIIYTNDLFNTYVFMEILSITTCSIISIKRKKENYTSAFRYVMLNEIGSLSYLFGVALLYMITGYTNIELVHGAIQQSWPLYSANVVTAVAFMVVGIGFKAAIFPFHIWLPDAHAAAPNSSSAILSAIVVKVYLLILVKVIYSVYGVTIMTALNMPLIIGLIAAVGMVMGSVFAIAQKDIKRMLGYSSVAQIGYIVMGISLMSVAGLSAAFFHIVSHGLMKAALFLAAGIIIYDRKIRRVNLFDGLGFQFPVSMFVFGIAALGMIGIPITTGFIAKFNLAFATLDAGRGIFIVIIVISGLLNALYYMPVLISAFLRDNPEKQRHITFEKAPRTMLVPVVVLGILILALGIYPDLIWGLLESAVLSLQ